ncbi:hypothetical protein ONE63_001007 [Megalurothrips usitatus]|uniref:Secreted protein n=1 Tax=Megalurothrips usitatus TaxID=439358 RepID=A0AAV7XAP4_9NEOP|nr:hypothetical protein ONE63_001007 [Megalurothrips usitatus]
MISSGWRVFSIAISTFVPTYTFVEWSGASVRRIFFQWVATVPDASVHSFKLIEEERRSSSEFFHFEAFVLLTHQVISNESDAQLPWQK